MLLACSMTITTIGCSSGPTVIPFEQEDIVVKTEQPLDKCVWPELQETILNTKIIYYMDAEGLKQQRSCQVTEQTNYGIAMNNAGSVDDVVNAFNKLIDKAELHNNYAQNELTRVDEMRQEKNIETWTLKGILAAVLIAIAL